MSLTCIPHQAINDKIKQLDFQECKVRVLNVDSQASFDNILVSVIGEISNKSEPSRKFVQTFVLAEQPNGYYVLNDIFRYMVDEEEEIAAEPPTPAAPATETPKAEAPVEETQVTEEVAATKVDEKLEEAEANGEVEQPEKAAPQTNGTPAVEETPAPVPAVEAEIVNDEKPETPEPSPVPEEKDVPEKDAAPTPAVPKTWASIALAGKGPAKAAAAAAAAAAPAAPAAPATSATPAAPKAAAPAAQASAAQPAAASPAPETARPQETGSTDAGWQTAGHDHKKSQPRAGEEQTTLAYIKNVNEKVDASLLKQTLARFGKLKYFDVSRPKNCAFVEFEQASGYAAAVAANPHQIGSEQILVEERRPRGNAFGGNGFPAGRGSGRGRGDRAGSQGRGGFQRDGRGGFAPRGRGGSGNVAAKGRSQAQAA
jgi:hypothetical protein